MNDHRNPTAGSQSGSPDTNWHLLELDPMLRPFQSDIDLRMSRYHQVRRQLTGGSLADWANGHHYFGFHRTASGWVYREWAPAADALYLFGDFNGWDRQSHPLRRLDQGVWELELDGAETLSHLSRVKVIVSHSGQSRDRIPLYIHKMVQDPASHDFSGQIWQPDQPFQWQHDKFRIVAEQDPLIYECHIGMAQEKYGIGTYREFADHILPRIKRQGYQAVQIMALMEHPYYASFGYHVAGYFAASSWFGDPDDLKYLVDRAHELGLAVLMDIVQSHAVKNTSEGINEFDGTAEQFFHSGERGNHRAWDSKVFNYGRHEVIHFLLSSIKYWLEEFHIDGFRFDGVTSMIYLDHGLGTAFDHYSKYFSLNTDIDAITYLQLANELIRELRPDSWSIAEDMSGMPGMCLPIADGGIGFDFRLSMGVPDFWVRTLQKSDDDWSINEMWYELTTSRPGEKRITYVESHDQALVGDKTLIFRMADQEMYWHMNRDSHNLQIDRAIALHKMIRLVTLTSGAEGYLNFMGNEFGHPEWIDFPREGNQWSFHYCRRQWSLADRDDLRYSDLNRFDQAMLDVFSRARLAGHTARHLAADQNGKILVYEHDDLVFVYNFHPTWSRPDLFLPVNRPGRYRVVFDTDELRFGGQARIDHQIDYICHPAVDSPGEESGDEKKRSGFSVYLPCRTALILQRQS